MKYITQSKFENELAKIRVRNKSYERKKLLKAEKNKYRNKIKLPSTTKLVMTYLFILLNTVLIYAMVAMWKFADLSYLGVLISDIAAQIMIYAIYCMKAYKAKKSEEEMKFKRDKYSGSLGDVLSAGAECKDEILGIIDNLENTEYQTENIETESVG